MRIALRHDGAYRRSASPKLAAPFLRGQVKTNRSHQQTAGLRLSASQRIVYSKWLHKPEVHPTRKEDTNSQVVSEPIRNFANPATGCIGTSGRRLQRRCWPKEVRAWHRNAWASRHLLRSRSEAEAGG
jgi:hypothetical protein